MTGSKDHGLRTRAARFGVAAVLFVACLGVALPVLAACASPGTNCYGRYRGLIVTDGGTKRGELDATSNQYKNNHNRRITNDPYGDRQEVVGRMRDLQVLNGESIYVRADWWKYGTFCYTSLVGLSSGASDIGVQVGGLCSNGWNQWATQMTGHTESGTFVGFSGVIVKGFQPDSDRMRAVVMVCEDQTLSGDPCSGTRFLEVNY